MPIWSKNKTKCTTKKQSKKFVEHSSLALPPIKGAKKQMYKNIACNIQIDKLRRRAICIKFRMGKIVVNSPK